MNSLPVRRSAATTALLALLMLLSLAASAFAQAQSVRVHFEARLTEDGEAVNDGIEWRIFSDRVDESGKLKLLSQSTGGKRTFEMRPGEYLVHAAADARPQEPVRVKGSEISVDCSSTRSCRRYSRMYSPGGASDRFSVRVI